MSQHQIPKFDDLMALEALFRSGTMQKAGEELFITHGAVSRRISRISNALGLPMTTAEGRGVRLTRAGRVMARATRDALSSIQTAVGSLQADDPHRPMVLSCERSIAARWLIPRLGDFQARYPDNTIHLSVGGGPLDFKKSEIDLALRRIDFQLEPSWEIFPLVDEAMGPVMAPGNTDCFTSGMYIALGSKTRKDGWERWFDANPDCPRPSDIRFLDHHFLVVEAAIAGLGVGLVPRLTVVDALKKQQLVAPSGFGPDGSYYGLISMEKNKSRSTADFFKKWLSENIGMD
ncbi:MAG: LysR family transcriptional regulator [Desulfobacter sp.]